MAVVVEVGILVIVCKPCCTLTLPHSLVWFDLGRLSDGDNLIAQLLKWRDVLSHSNKVVSLVAALLQSTIDGTPSVTVNLTTLYWEWQYQ